MKKIIVAVATLVAGAVVAQLVNLYLTRDITDAAFANIYSALTTPVTPLWLLLLLAACTFFLIGLGILDMIKIAKLQGRIVELTCTEAKPAGPVSMDTPADKPDGRMNENIVLALDLVQLDTNQVLVLAFLGDCYAEDGHGNVSSLDISQETGLTLLRTEQVLEQLQGLGLVKDALVIGIKRLYSLSAIGREWLLAHGHA